jgi:hypothetical protein
MSILERLFLKKTEVKKDETLSLSDFVFDWFNAAKIDVKRFERDFLEPAIALYKSKNEYLVRHFESEPDQANATYFSAIGIMYLAYHTADVDWMKKLFAIFMNEKSSTYQVRELALRGLDWQLRPANPEIFLALDTGSKILLVHHAINVRWDINLGDIGKVSYFLSESRRDEERRCFDKLFEFVNGQSFNEKPFVFFDTLNRRQLDRRTGELKENHRFSEVLQQAFSESITEYNATHSLRLDEDELTALLKFLTYKDSAEFKKVDYKKRKFIKVKDFKECDEFVAFSRGREVSCIQNLVYYLGNSYISDEERLFADTINQIISNVTFEVDWLKQVCQTAFRYSDIFITQHVIIPVLNSLRQEIRSTNPVVGALEKKFFQRPLEFGTGVEYLREIASAIEDESERRFQLARLSSYYVKNLGDSYYGFTGELEMEPSDKKFPIIKNLIDDLSVIIPVALKGVEKRNYFYYEEEGKFFNINFKNQDVTISSNFIRDINQLLEQEQTGYQLITIPVLEIEAREGGQPKHIAALAYMSLSEFTYLNSTYVSERFPKLLQEGVFKGVQYGNKNAEPFSLLKEKKKNTDTQTVGNVFLNDVNWAWFKERYVDQLKSKDQWYEIMNLIVQASGSKKPNAAWLKEISARISALGFTDYFRELQVLLSDSLKEEFWYFDTYRNALKGLLWTCTHLQPTAESLNTVRMIIETAYTKVSGIGPKSAAVGNAALDALIDSGREEAFGILTVMRNKTKYNRFVTVLEKYIDKFKSTSDIPEETLADKSIPKFGFENGEKRIQLGQYQARIYFEDNKVKKEWIDPDGKSLKSAPAGLDEKTAKEVNEEVKQISQVFTDLKKRIRMYWLHTRSWNGSLWKAYVLEHPLMRPHIENLVWSNQTNGKSFIVQGDRLLEANGNETSVNESDVIAFWHPVVSRDEEIEQWQEYIWKNNIVQPERQVFREHYPFTDRELGEVSTPRFAHHFLEVKKLMAIANSAGWIFTYIHEGVNWPRVYIKPLNITAHLSCDYDRSDFAIPTKDLYFTEGDSTKINDYKTKYERIPIKNIPLMTLSEICRDIDLFIATTSVSINPELSSQRQELGNYRLDYMKGLFSDNASARIRRTIIEKLIPVLKISSPGFEGNYLLVKGKVNEYRINLGSGFAQVKDTQQHINLIPDIKKVKSNKKLHLPIEDDETLYIILAKALYLQADDTGFDRLTPRV